MAKSYFGLVVTVLITALVSVGSAPVRAAEAPENAVLKKHTLKIVGSLAVLEAESDIKGKLTEIKRLHKQLSYSLMQQQGTMTPEQYQQTIKGLTTEISDMSAQIRLANQQMSSLPRFRGRFASTYAQAQYNELLYYRNQLQAGVNQETAWLNQLKNQKFDPKSKEKVDGEVRDQREALHQALIDLRKVVDTATEKYTELAKDGDVKKAVAAAGKARGEKLKLGPSHDFLNNIKLLEKLENADSSADAEQSQAKPARRTRSGTKSKRSLRSAPGAGSAAKENSDSPS